MGGKLSKLGCCFGSREQTESFLSVSGSTNEPSNELVQNESIFKKLSPLQENPSPETHSLTSRISYTDGSVINSIVDPVISKEEIYLLNIFPQEIWCLIVDNVTDANDKESLNNSSHFFRFFLPPRHEFLFPKVAIALLIYFRDDYREPEVDSDEDDDDILWENSSDDEQDYEGRCYTCRRKQKSDWFSEFLKLRLICKHWCDTIDHMFQNQAIHFSMRHDNEDVPCKGFDRLARVDFHDRHDPRDMVAHFQETHGHHSNERSPFLGRELRFFVNNFWPDYLPRLINLLSKYGHHIWYASILFEDKFRTRVICYSKMSQVLRLLPNLKVLYIQYFELNNIVLTEEDLADLRDEIAWDPIPTIGTLKFLKIFNLPPLILQEVISRNSHVSMLDVKRFTEDYDYDISTWSLPNIKQLSMEICSEENFGRLEHVTWSLEKLHLEFRKDIFIRWGKIFYMIERKWKESLTNLRLALPKATTTEEINSIITDSLLLRPNLVVVETIMLDMQNYCFLDFILGMKDTLVHLNVTLKYRKSQQHERKMMRTKKHWQKIQFYGHFHKLGESNIWRICSNLEEFDFKGPGLKQLSFGCRRSWIDIP